MAHTLGLEFAGKTDTGRVRSQNEDAIVISPAYGFAVLADGMGGYNAGEVASGMATAATKDLLEQVLARLQEAQTELLTRQQFNQLVVDAIKRANAAIVDAARAEPQYEGMGTTLVAAVFHGDQATIAHVGDSRGYRFRNGTLEQITRDHSLLQEQIDAGLIDSSLARFSATKNLVTRAVGVGTEVEVEIHDHAIQTGDIYLLCSDGLSDMLSDREISDILHQQQESLDAACGVLVDRANHNGGLDNISVILVKVLSTGSGTPGLLTRLRNWVNRSIEES